MAVMPLVDEKPTTPEVDPGLHPLLVGLIKTLPHDGKPFPANKQRQWLEAAKVNLALIFGNDELDAQEGASAQRASQPNAG